jgi:uncharacterized protein with HEPN domain
VKPFAFVSRSSVRLAAKPRGNCGNLHLKIPWGEIKGMRNILIHEYWQIDPAIVYDVARNEAELLASLLQDVIKKANLAE